jgi:photosystem II stability/assembly factor-like uncharacterized protein
MNRNRQVSDLDRGLRTRRPGRVGVPRVPSVPRALRGRRVIPALPVLPVLSVLGVAGLLGGCAVASSSVPRERAPFGTGQAASSTASPGSAQPGGGASAAGGCAGSGAAGSGVTSATATAPLQAIQFAGAGHGWAAGDDRILATSDGGRTWTRQYAGPADLGQVDFVSTAVGWAVGPGALLRTVNGGASWTTLSEPRVNGHCASVSAVHFVSPVLGYAIASTGGAGGQLLRSSDGGVTWSAVAGAPDGVRTACFSAAQDGYLGVPGQIWRTTDAGATWSLAFTEPPESAGQAAGRTAAADTPELGCAAHDAAWVLFLGSGVAMMHAPYLAYATQDGTSWHGVLEESMLETAIRPKLHLPAGPGSEPGPFSVISSGAAAFVGYTPPANTWGAAPLIVATDGGAVLDSAGDIPAINEPLAAAFLSSSQGWVVGENLKADTYSIEATTDEGHSWTTEYTTS